MAKYEKGIYAPNNPNSTTSNIDSNNNNNVSAFVAANKYENEDEENPKAKQQIVAKTNERTVNFHDEYWSYHLIVCKHFLLILLDVPFPVLSIFTLWRLPWLINKLFRVISCL